MLSRCHVVMLSCVGYAYGYTYGYVWLWVCCWVVSCGYGCVMIRIAFRCSYGTLSYIRIVYTHHIAYHTIEREDVPSANPIITLVSCRHVIELLV